MSDAEEFTDDQRRAGLALHVVEGMDPPEAPDTDTRKAMVAFWSDETLRWYDAYYRLIDEIDRYNDWRDPTCKDAMVAELAIVADNVAECAWSLVSSLALKK